MKITDFTFQFLCYLFMLFAVIVVCEHLIPFTKPWHLIVAVLSVIGFGVGIVHEVNKY